jgi:hypothetical protein
MLTPTLARVTLAPLVAAERAQSQSALVQVLQLEKELTTLRGILALDAGEPAAAEKWFRQALNAGGGEFESRGIAARYLDHLRPASGR